MSRSKRVPRDLADAANAYALREELVQALGRIVSRPLTEDVSEELRAVLERVDTPETKRAVRRMARQEDPRPPLVAVPSRTAPISGDLVVASTRKTVPLVAHSHEARAEISTRTALNSAASLVDGAA